MKGKQSQAKLGEPLQLRRHTNSNRLLLLSLGQINRRFIRFASFLRTHKNSSPTAALPLITARSSPIVEDSAKMANAASGMAVNEECKLKFLELKAKRTHRFVIFKIEEKTKEVVVEKLGEPVKTYEDFAACLPENECRYAVYDFDFVTAENCQKSRIFFIAWSPDTARVRSKMIYASSKDRFKRELDGIQVELQATDPTEIGLDVFKSRTN